MDQSAFARLPLRERKHAHTKLALLGAVLRALETRGLEAITVKELCEAVPISEASFFNYFPQKSDLLVYYVQLWSLEMGWHASRAGRGSALAAIEDIFARTAGRVAAHPGVMAEIIAAQVRMVEAPRFVEITRAERLLAFPSLPGIEAVTATGIDELLPPLLARAVSGGELPPDTDRGAAFRALAAIFFGVPVVHRRREGAAVAAAYETQLRLLWAGLRAAPGTPA